MNYLKYYRILLNAEINKYVQRKYIKIPSKYKSVLIRNYGELYLYNFFDEIWVDINKFLAEDKEILLKLISFLIKKNKKIYLLEEIKVLTDEDIKNLYKLSKNIFVKPLYMEKSKSIASNQILLCDISSYVLIIEKLDYFEKICCKYYTNDFDRALFTIVQLSDYLKFGKMKRILFHS